MTPKYMQQKKKKIDELNFTQAKIFNVSEYSFTEWMGEILASDTSDIGLKSRIYKYLL